jgi:hypothetical protein
MSRDEYSPRAMIWTVVAGVITGGALGLVLAPRSGAETRRAVAELFSRWRLARSAARRDHTPAAALPLDEVEFIDAIPLAGLTPPGTYPVERFPT